MDRSWITGDLMDPGRGLGFLPNVTGSLCHMLNKRVTWKMALADVWRMDGLSQGGREWIPGRMCRTWARNGGDSDQLVW